MDKVRGAAVKVLLAVHDDGAYANIALTEVFKKYHFTGQERRFLTELVYGSVKAGETLDWIIQRYAKRPIGKMTPAVRAILRLGMFQLFFLDRIPASAVCNESTELAKRFGHIGTVKFVNAVLRSAVREPERAFPAEDDTPEFLSIKLQHPVWLIRRWLHVFGREETEKLCVFNNTPAILSLRTNLLRIDRDSLLTLLRKEGAEAHASEWAPEGIICTKHGALEELDALQKGLFQVQDESSMQVAHVLDPHPGEFLIDLCSAPGGKTTHLAERMNNQGRILALDIYDAKLKRVEENAKRLGISIIQTQCMDAREIGENFFGQADRVLADVPCSGLGVLRRRPDARWKKNEEEISQLPIIQRAILRSAAHVVKPGGIIVYSTCTIEPDENESVVRSFLDTHEGFHLESAGAYLPLKPSSHDMVQFYPQRDGIDGFFIARIRRDKG